MGMSNVTAGVAMGNALTGLSLAVKANKKENDIAESAF
jgi:hypothetical protein